MIQMQNILGLVTRNKHTSGAAVALLLGSALEFLGPLWFPAKQHEFEETGKWLARLAGAYGLAAAGDASQGVTKEEADTRFVTKEELERKAGL
jgi:hypothetical protein